MTSSHLFGKKLCFQRNDQDVAESPDLPSHVCFLWVLNMLTGQLILQKETSTVGTMATPTAFV